MRRNRESAPEPSRATGVLGIEAGGTRTTACWLASPTAPPRLATFEAANLQLVADAQLLALFRRIAKSFPLPRALGIAMAGARTEADRLRIRTAADLIWPGVPAHATHDLEAALAAAAPDAVVADASARSHRLLVLSGTGSCCYGVSPRSPGLKVGGWGHLLGDQGSGYDIALNALRALIQEHDRTGTWSPAGGGILKLLGMATPDDLIPWVGRASKRDVAALAPLIFRFARRGDRICRAVLATAANSLAHAALACAQRLGVRPPGQTCQVVLAGSVLRRQPAFARRVTAVFLQKYPRAQVTPLTRSGAVGAARLALQPADAPSRIALRKTTSPPAGATAAMRRLIPSATRPSPTEARHPASRFLDRMPLRDAVRLFIDEDRRLPDALLTVAPQIERAVRLIGTALGTQGRLFYVGAGTSGRLGVLDASECPPTFRTSPELVQGILAGGEAAMFRAVEGAEDDYEGGQRALKHRKLTARDVVVGIAASGRTPFLWGALAEARRVCARTILVTFQPHLRFQTGTRPDVVIAPDLGPELLTGSTRLKSGTATKQILNIFTTLAMVRLGKVMGNLMVDLNASNVKLRDRAVRIVRDLTGASEDAARAALLEHDWTVRQSVESLRRP